MKLNAQAKIMRNIFEKLERDTSVLLVERSCAPDFSKLEKALTLVSTILEEIRTITPHMQQ